MELLLIFDTFIDPEGKGLRGASQARHLLFHSEDWDLDLMVSKNGQAVNLEGQVLPRRSSDLTSVFNAVVVLLQGPADLIKSTKLTSRGEFEFRDIPESDLRVEVFLKSQRITAAFHP